jgi:hypothetical protein
LFARSKELSGFAANKSRYIEGKLLAKRGWAMDIILQGMHTNDETVESLQRVLQLFKERYNIHSFREIHLTVTLVDDQGDDVELIDSESKQSYRVFEVYRPGYELDGRKGTPVLELVVDNTKNH